jgi:hypothetical protein
MLRCKNDNRNQIDYLDSPLGQCPVTAHVSGGKATREIIAANLEDVVRIEV